MSKLGQFVDKCTGASARRTRKEMDDLSAQLSQTLAETFSQDKVQSKGASQSVNLPRKSAGQGKTSLQQSF